jgi:hypothetical protein
MAAYVGSPEPKTKAERIERLRARLAKVYTSPELVAIFKGLLDLLDDEL